MTVTKLTDNVQPLDEVNKINEIIDNLGSTADQTYDSTSTNAQSGVAIAGAKFIQNTATNENSITVGGTATTAGGAINAGVGSSVTATGGTAVGRNAEITKNYGTAVGYTAKVTGNYAVQLGYGTNSTASTFSVGFYASSSADRKNWTLLNGTTGLIPNERLNVLAGADGINAGTAGIVPAPSATDNTKYLKGDGTWASALTNTATGSNAITIEGTAATSNYATNIGFGSEAGTRGTAIGRLATATGQRALALGFYSTASAQNAIQLGYGTNSTDNTLSVGFNNTNWQLLDGTTGLIPPARLNVVTSVSSSSTNAQIPSAKLFYDTVGNIETLLSAI